MPAFPRFDAERSLQLFAITMVVLLMPKIFGLLLSLLQGKTRRGSGGAIRLVLSALFEVVMSALLAPVMMLIQTGHVVHFLFGFDTGWDPQRRDDGSIPFMAIVKRHRSHVVFGLLALVSGLLISPSLVAWMSPTIAGLVLAIFLSWATGPALGRHGASPPRPADDTRGASQTADRGRARGDDPRRARWRSGGTGRRPAPALRRPGAAGRAQSLPAGAHVAASAARSRPTGRSPKPSSTMPTTIEDALAWLKPKERMAVLNDSVLVDTLLRLPNCGLARSASGPQKRASG